MRDPHEIILAPLISEKSSVERAKGTYTFRVHKWATKVDIRVAIEKLFNVKVNNVNMLNIKGKVRGTFGKGFGKTKSWKKAYVTLKKGQKIETLEAR